MSYRRDSLIEMAQALASSDYVESVVHLSESPLYHRSFASIYETLKRVEIDEESLLAANIAMCEKVSERLSGIAIYSGDSTFIEKPCAETMAERSMKRQNKGGLVYGQESYWSTRLPDIEKKSSWTGIIKVDRMAGESVTEMAGKHLLAMDKATNKDSKQLYVLDAGHGKDILVAQQQCSHTDVVLRVKTNQKFYGKAEPRKTGKRGRPAKHGALLKLNAAADKQPEADGTILEAYEGKQLSISYWRDQHYYRYADTVGTILKVAFLNAQGHPLYKQPIWLFTSNTTFDAQIIATAYLKRMTHELSFRFLKQHLALKKVQSPELKHQDAWLQLVAMAMNLLLASREHIQVESDRWYPQQKHKPITPRRAQKHALAFFSSLARLIKPPRPAGKGKGRAKGYRPAKRKKHKVIRKTPKRPKKCKSCGVLQV